MNSSCSVVDALESLRCLITVVGEHAGEPVDRIVPRKQADIASLGVTFWVIKSRQARPAAVTQMCQGCVGYVFFIVPSVPGGAKATKVSDEACEYSPNQSDWQRFPTGLGAVTGNLGSDAHALVLDSLVMGGDATLDLLEYGDFEAEGQPVRLARGCSSVCAYRANMHAHPGKMKSRYRRIIAVGRLASPYSVWVR